MARSDRIFFVFAVLFAGAAIYHFIAVFITINDLPLSRQFIFILIDLAIAYGLLKRPKYFIYVFIILLVQQYYTHGFKLMEEWNNFKKIDYVSLLVLCVLPFILFFLLKDYHQKKKELSSFKSV